MKGWHFDIGLKNGEIIVDAFPSGQITDKRFRGLSRKAMIDLKKKINHALRNFPKDGGQ